MTQKGPICILIFFYFIFFKDVTAEPEPEPEPVAEPEPEPVPVVERPVRSRGKTPLVTRTRTSEHKMVRSSSPSGNYPLCVVAAASVFLP